MTTTSKQSLSALTSVGIDIGKDVFHIVGFAPEGRIALRRKIKRLALTREFKKLPPCIVGMEACLSAHFVSSDARTSETSAVPSHSKRQCHARPAIPRHRETTV